MNRKDWDDFDNTQNLQTRYKIKKEDCFIMFGIVLMWSLLLIL